MTYALFQSATTTANLPTVLAARSAVIMISTPLGTAIGGPLVGTLGAAQTLTACGAATLLLAAVSTVAWRHDHRDVSIARSAVVGGDDAAQA
jgi:predicted MFS family arabinose efflux permease